MTFTGNATNNNNRMDLYSYDSAGNLLNDGVHSYFYDAENHLIQVDGSLPYCTSNGASGSAATACYYYDASGRRVHRTGYTNDTCDSTGKRDYIFDLEGRIIVENNVNGTACDIQVYAGDRHFGRQGGGSFFYHSDWLGTVRLINSDQNPTYGSEICTSLPFGDGLTCNSNYSNVWHFTGKERDSESGLDNFGARYDSSSIGRFMSPDPLLNSGRPWDPQTWNRFAYARNNPLNIIDPTGLYNTPDHCNDGDKKCEKKLNKNREELRKAVENLTEKVEKMKDGPEKARLQASLRALGTAEDGNNVFVNFGATQGGGTGETVATYDADSKETSFNVTLDPSQISTRNDMAIDAAHEGTHVADISDPRYANPATTLSDFSLEYRGYQTSAYAAQALGYSPLAYDGGRNVIWNSSWADVDRQTLMDKGITQHVTSIPGHPVTTPHNPWDN